MITGLSLFAIFVVSMALVVLLSAFNGLENKIISSLNLLDPPLLVVPAEGKTQALKEDQVQAISELPEVKGLSRVLEENMLILYGSEQIVGLVRGVDRNYPEIFGFQQYMVEGDARLFREGLPAVLMGEAFADRIGLRLNDPFTPFQLFAPKSGKTDLLQPFREKSLVPGGVFFIPQEANRNLLIVPIRVVEELTGRSSGEISSLHIITHSGDAGWAFKKKVKEILGENWELKDRLEQHDAINKILRAEKLMVTLIVGFILLIASFNLVSVQTLLIVEKQKDLRILWSMGAEWKSIRRIFTLLGTLVSVLGGVLGVILGLLIVLLQRLTGWFKLNEYEPYPVVVQFSDVLMALLMVIFIGWLVSWWRMSRIDLRH